MRILYPSDVFSPKKVDEVYGDEFEAVQQSGLDVSLFSFEDFQGGTFTARPALKASETVIYRGWMMTKENYEQFIQQLAVYDAVPTTSASDYLLCHHLPNWYPLLKSVTAETRFYSEHDNVAASLKEAGWSGCFLKDYVKSLSTDGGSLVQDLSNLSTVVARMRKYRGCIEGGLCARRIEEYDVTTEKRFFISRGTAMSDDGEPIPDIVNQAASTVHSPFFSVDIARRLDGTLRVIELGDGQVSDRKHWSVESFVSVLKHLSGG